MTVSSAPADLGIFPAELPPNRTAKPAAAAVEVSHEASERYTSLGHRVRSSCSVVSTALRLGLLELRSDNDLSRILKALRGLNDRQLRILGFDRANLVDEVRELILIEEGRNFEHDGNGGAMRAVHAALGRAA